MPVMFWTDTAMCRDRQTCGQCREPGARAFRAAVLRTFHAPAGGIDFPCPHGLPWSAPLPGIRPPVARKAVAPVPTWGELETATREAFPASLPELWDWRQQWTAPERCTPCQELARRKRWAERLAGMRAAL